MIDLLADPQSWLAFFTLSLLEIVLGLDNIIFISILVSRLPAPRQGAARITGLALAMLTRVALLFSIVWLTRDRIDDSANEAQGGFGVEDIDPRRGWIWNDEHV